jgi:hypothetical protein
VFITSVFFAFGDVFGDGFGDVFGDGFGDSFGDSFGDDLELMYTNTHIFLLL